MYTNLQIQDYRINIKLDYYCKILLDLIDGFNYDSSIYNSFKRHDFVLRSFLQIFFSSTFYLQIKKQNAIKENIHPLDNSF
jgi:hypothetical protein